MRVQIFSDLHSEFERCDVKDAGADVIVMAGDIGVGVKGVEFIESLKLKRPVIYVAGNHEFYREKLPGAVEKIRAASHAAGIYFLENKAVEIDGVRFLGCTLWTNFRLFGAESLIAAAIESRERMNDYKRIRMEPEYRKMTPKDAGEMHRRSVAWMRAEWGKSKLPTVVVTHHAPLLACVRPVNRDRLITAADASDLSGLIEELQPRLWISGHTHYAVDFIEGETRVVSNPRGYPDEIVQGFVDEKVVEVRAGEYRE